MKLCQSLYRFSSFNTLLINSKKALKAKEKKGTNTVNFYEHPFALQDNYQGKSISYFQNQTNNGYILKQLRTKIWFDLWKHQMNKIE